MQRSIHEEVVERLGAFSKTLKVGDPLDPTTNLGPLISQRQLDKVLGYLDQGPKEGARLVTGGHRLGGELSNGYYVAPTVFGNVNNTMTIAREEIFGPVLSIMSFRTPDEAIEKANNTCYGLSAGVWTDKGSKILKMAAALKAGVVWANTYNKFDPSSPFGGYKESGFGREGGKHGLLDYASLQSTEAG